MRRHAPDDRGMISPPHMVGVGDRLAAAAQAPASLAPRSAGRR